MPDAPAEILLLRKMHPLVEAAFEGRHTVHRLAGAADPEAMLAEIGPRIRALCVGGQVGVDAALMDRLPNLELIANFGVGYDAVDAVEAHRRGITVTNTPDVLTDEVADLAVDPVPDELDPPVAGAGLGDQGGDELVRLDLVRHPAQVAAGAGDVAPGAHHARQVGLVVHPAGVGGRAGVAQQERAGVAVDEVVDRVVPVVAPVVAQVVAPVLRSRSEDAPSRAAEQLQELADLSAQLHGALLEARLREVLRR